MCGRFTLSIDEFDFADRFSRDKSYHYKPIYNVLPTQEMPILVSNSETITPAKWGLPSNFKNKIHINARAETIQSLSSFKSLIHSHRCIIPADSFIEWDKSPLHQPHRIMLTSHHAFCFAGVYNELKINDESHCYFSIITTESNSQLKWLHNRMPLILNEEQEKEWLTQSNAWQKILDLKSTVSLDIFPINARITNSKANRAELLLPIQKPLTLF